MHLTEDDLILHFYREGAEGGRAAIDAHLNACGDCRAGYERLTRVLSAVEADSVPARGATYGTEVWQRLRPRLPAEPPRRWFSRDVPRWAFAGAAAVVLAVAFIAGRYWPAAPVSVPVPVQSSQVRERVLLVAVGDHLERSQMVLVELMNLPAGQGIDISPEQQWARELVASNRLYRQTAAKAGEAGVESVLDELEPILLEIVHSPSTLPSAEVEAIRQRIEAKGILFKVRVIGTQVREREKRVERGSKSAGSQGKQT